jgi:carboxypeptidase Taq
LVFKPVKTRQKITNLTGRFPLEAKLANLKNRMQEYMDLRWAAALLSWDQATYMPPEGASGRGRQMALLTRISFEKLGDPEVGKLLDELEPWAETLPFDHDDAAFVRETRRTYDRQVRIPPALIAEFYTHSAQSYHAWVKARPANDFEAVRPYLEKTLEYSRRLADYFPGYDHIADPLIDMADYGMKAADGAPRCLANCARH